MSMFRAEVGSMLNQQLGEVFRMMKHPTPFRLWIAKHLEERYQQRVEETHKREFVDLLKRIPTVGICELLYYHTRHILGEDIAKIEFINGDVIIPFNISRDFINLNTVFVRAPEQDRSEYRQIDLSVARLAQR